MKKIKRVILRGFKNKLGWLIPKFLLKSMAGECDMPVPVILGLDSRKIIGKIKRFEYSKGELIAIGEFYEDIDLKGKVFRPSFYSIESHVKKGTLIHDKIELNNIHVIDKTEDVYE